MKRIFGTLSVFTLVLAMGVAGYSQSPTGNCCEQKLACCDKPGGCCEQDSACCHKVRGCCKHATPSCCHSNKAKDKH